MKNQKIFAVSGVKNSGKTTLIAGLIPFFRERGMSVAVIKHDGHDFEPDVPGTDSFKMRNAGADGVAVFSDRRIMVIRESSGVSEKDLIRAFPDADLILLEGFKYSGYPKVEVVRKSVSERPVCDPGTLLAMVTDFSKEELPEDFREIPLFVPNEWGTEQLADYLISRMKL